MDSFESSVLKKYRRLSQFLIASSLLNVAFISSSVYQYFKPAQPAPWMASKVILTQDAASVLKAVLNTPYPELVSQVLNKTSIEPGLLKRDLVLAVLSESYFIDVARALNRPQIHVQYLTYDDAGKSRQLPVPRGLADSDFELVAQFLKQEAWPLTAKGLFLKLKFGIKDDKLKQSFYRAPQFSKIYDALKPTLSPLNEEKLCLILLKGDVTDLEKFSLEIESGQFQPEAFLTHYILQKSAYAASLLVDLESFTPKSLTDKEALCLLESLAAFSDKQKQVAQELLSSFRHESFKQEVLSFVPNLESKIASVSQKEEIKQKIELPKKTLEQVPAKSARTYVVQEGDSLWKISRKFKIDVESIKTANHLETENLKAGKVLIIP